MASSFHFLSLIFFSLLFLSPSQAKGKNSFHPHALLLPVQKDPSTLLYTTQLNQRTLQVSENLTLDLGGQFLWVDCEKGYSFTSYRRARCSKNRRELFPENTVISAATSGELGSDVVLIQSTDGTNPGRVVSVPHFLFVCGPTFLLKGRFIRSHQSLLVSCFFNHLLMMNEIFFIVKKNNSCYLNERPFFLPE